MEDGLKAGSFSPAALSALQAQSAIRGRVPNDKEQLEALKAHHAWLPGRDQIRPIPEIKARKLPHMEKLRRSYVSEADYVLQSVFGFAPSKRSDGSQYVDRDRVAQRGQSKRFTRQLFPYNVDKWTKHFVLWYLEPPGSDDEINSDIIECITNYNARGAQAPFAWYENPKMTVPDLYHVQVFWHFPPTSTA